MMGRVTVIPTFRPRECFLPKNSIFFLNCKQSTQQAVTETVPRGLGLG